MTNTIYCYYYYCYYYDHFRYYHKHTHTHNNHNNNSIIITQLVNSSWTVNSNSSNHSAYRWLLATSNGPARKQPGWDFWLPESAVYEMRKMYIQIMAKNTYTLEQLEKCDKNLTMGSRWARRGLWSRPDSAPMSLKWGLRHLSNNNESTVRRRGFARTQSIGQFQWKFTGKVTNLWTQPLNNTHMLQNATDNPLGNATQSLPRYTKRRLGGSSAIGLCVSASLCLGVCACTCTWRLTYILDKQH